MAGIPTCQDCSVPMIVAKGYHAILAFEPPEDLDYEQFSPVSLYVCGKCGQVRFYLAGPESWARESLEAVSYGYRLTGQEPAAAAQRPGDQSTVPRKSRA